MINNHYVPRLVLRKFGEKLSLYNVRTGELKENIRLEKAYAKRGFYDEKIEEELNHNVESQFAGILSNLVLKCDNTICLSRKNLLIIKKFLLISMLRSIESEEWSNREKDIYKWYSVLQPFEEKESCRETPREYWLRTLRVVLETDGTPQQILAHPDKTSSAYRWANIVNSAYIAFWDAPDNVQEFVITDIGMTSENEKGWNGITVHNDRKLAYISKIISDTKDRDEQAILYSIYQSVLNFSENFMMFPISAKRMIVLICPFFKLRYHMKLSGIEVPHLQDITVIPNETLFAPNGNDYVYPRAKNQQYHDDDRYIYDIKRLSIDEIRYCNALFMDRVNTYLGFSALDKVAESVLEYRKLNMPPYIPRVDYTKLYRIIEHRYYRYNI